MGVPITVLIVRIIKAVIQPSANFTCHDITGITGIIQVIIIYGSMEHPVPHYAAGVTALLLSKDPSLTPAQVFSKLTYCN